MPAGAQALAGIFLLTAWMKEMQWPWRSSFAPVRALLLAQLRDPIAQARGRAYRLRSRVEQSLQADIATAPGTGARKRGSALGIAAGHSLGENDMELNDADRRYASGFID